MLLCVASGVAWAQTRPQTVEIYSAGSLRGVVAELTREAAASYHIDVKASFGGSGALRERIEKGERPDLLMSADVGNPRKLASEGRAVVPAVAFARNRMCIVSRRSAGVTAANLVDKMLAKSVRIKTSTPIADPAGDYAWAIFDRIEAMRPGAGAALKQKAEASMNLTPARSSPAQSPAAALFASNQIDLSITYCSASASLEKELPELTSLAVPAALDPHPLYGIAVLSEKPAAQKLALFLLSEKGQAIIASQGLVPLTDGDARP
jgi:molybdate transport system substrate-binding protein